MGNEEEKKVWTTIANNVNKRIDSGEFEKIFKEIDRDFSKNIIFLTINCFASDTTIEDISKELSKWLDYYGLKWKQKEIIDFVSDLIELFSLEIYATRYAYSITNYGDKSETACPSISKTI